MGHAALPLRRELIVGRATGVPRQLGHHAQLSGLAQPVGCKTALNLEGGRHHHIGSTFRRRRGQRPALNRQVAAQGAGLPTGDGKTRLGELHDTPHALQFGDIRRLDVVALKGGFALQGHQTQII